MSVRLLTRLTLGYVILFAIAVTWPGMVPFNRVEPFVLGLPFNLVWVACWVVLGFVLLVLLDRAVTREEDQA